MKTIAAFVGVAALLLPGLPVLAQTANPSAPPYAVPADPAAAATLGLIDAVCLPLLRGSPLKSIAAQAGLRSQNGDWTLRFGGRGEAVVQPPDVANPHVCQANLTHRIGAQVEIVAALTAWANAQRLQPVNVQKASTGPDYAQTAWSWTGQAAGGSLDILFAAQKGPHGEPLAGGLDQSLLVISLAPAAAGTKLAGSPAA